uniref:Uncharacterized protein n=1 Tax=viral metagenome TaxID=1070528 RepID=A0A6C0C6Q6_9ZZZZ
MQSTYKVKIALVEDWRNNGFDVAKLNPGENLFLNCQTRDEVELLLHHKYIEGWYNKKVFEHIKKILRRPPSDILEALVPNIPIDQLCGIYSFYIFDDKIPTCYEKCGHYFNLFHTAILMGSTLLLQKITGTVGDYTSKQILNFSIEGKPSTLVLGCGHGYEDMILFLLDYCESQKDIICEFGSPLYNYVKNYSGWHGYSREIVKLLVTKKDTDSVDTMAAVRKNFDDKFVTELQQMFKDDPVQKEIKIDSSKKGRDLGNLVDIYGNIIRKNPAELAIAVFDESDKLSEDRMERIFIKSGEMIVTDIEGTRHCKKFINGLYIDIPICSNDDNKVRFHMLTIYDKDMLVRFDKLYYEGKWREFC